MGFVANSEKESDKGRRSVARLCSEQFGLLSERRLPIAGMLRLVLAHHVNHLDSIQDHTSSDRRLETGHGSARLFMAR
jgi:hypothetical protein